MSGEKKRGTIYETNVEVYEYSVQIKVPFVGVPTW